jgi:uncharacterized MnhB-related membrane protein
MPVNSKCIDPIDNLTTPWRLDYIRRMVISIFIVQSLFELIFKNLFHYRAIITNSCIGLVVTQIFAP